MKRNEHLFRFRGAAIGKAAKAEADYHDARAKHWAAEQEKLVKRAKKAGVQVVEQAVTGGRQVNMYVDSTIQGRLSTCASKINAHRAAADRFRIEAGAYSSQPGETYELHPDDVVYFRLAGGPRED